MFTYTAILAIGLALFSVLTLAAIDVTMHRTLDARLATTARAFAATAGSHIAQANTARVRDRLLSVLGIQQNGAILLGNGTVVMESNAVPRAVASSTTRGANDETPFTTVQGTDGDLRVDVLHLAGSTPAVAVLWRPLDVVEDDERIAGITLTVTSLVLLACAMALGGTILERALRPLREMAAIASEIEARDLSRRLGKQDWDDELREFAATFDRMLDRLESAFLRQREFTADASHDLRAPLSVMRAEVDLALALPRNPVSDAKALLSFREEVQELDQLVDALLLAARADAGMLDHIVISFKETLERAIERITPFAASQAVRIVKDVALTSSLIGSSDIIERVIISLLHNGIKFSPRGGTVKVEAAESIEAVSLTIADEGGGFTDEALAHAFDRFWKGDRARGRSGSGLGLSIAKTAVERVGGSIQIRNSERGGAKIEVSLPKYSAVER